MRQLKNNEQNWIKSSLDVSFHLISSNFILLNMAEENKVLTVQEVADRLNVSKASIYKLNELGEIRSFKVGRKLRFSQEDVDAFIKERKGICSGIESSSHAVSNTCESKGRVVICGQDIILDALSNYLSQAGFLSLRSYVGSYDALTSLYKDEVQVASAHLWDGRTGTYNVPFVRRLLPGTATVIVNLTYRTQGFYVQKGNPKKIRNWVDLLRDDVTLVNREKGAGSRVLLDEHMQLLGKEPALINGYQNEVRSHIAVASAVARGVADVAIGSEKIASQVDGIDFIPLQKERYDLVFKKANFDSPAISALMDILESGILREEFSVLGGYATKDMGRIIQMGF